MTDERTNGAASRRVIIRSSSLRPTASIARSISWGFCWRKLIRVICTDLFALIVAGAAFTWFCSRQLPAQALDGILYERGGISVLAPDSWRFSGTGFDVSTWVYRVFGADGKTYTFAVQPYAKQLAPYAIFALFCQALELLDFFSDTRRVRRKLQPLNDLAIAAEAMGQYTAVSDPMASADKMATLEQAIERATVDSPTVSTGDKDLRSIEVALNGLLRQMQEAKLQQMRFVSDASHELRTPIAVIQGYVNMLDRWGKTDESVLDESIEALKAESDHMKDLVEQLLFLARGDSGRNTLDRTNVNMAEVVHEVWEESRMIDDTHVYACPLTEADLLDQTLVTVGDLGMLKQSLRIIVQNAQKYSAEGTTITLGAKRDGDQVLCSITDEGVGMSEHDMRHIFDRFYRADSARDGAADGSGLGLSIAKWIVDAHDGSIEVVSSEGVGTRFTVLLPTKA